MVSNRYDYPKGKYCNGDPAMIWMNPVEQQIDQQPFGFRVHRGFLVSLFQ